MSLIERTKSHRCFNYQHSMCKGVFKKNGYKKCECDCHD